MKHEIIIAFSYLAFSLGFCFIPWQSHAQLTITRQVIGSAGSNTTGSGLTASWTAGEAVIGTSTTGAFTLTQGFQQSYEMLINVQLILSGAYESSGQMNTTLNDNNILPLNQPYNTAPWNYSGTESVTSMPLDAVDWILMSLRNSTDYHTIVETRAVLLHSDGTVTDADGSPVNFTAISANDFYVEVLHGNHLSIMTAVPVNFSAFPSLDFTISGAAYDDTGDNDAPQKEVETGIWAMYAGNANANGKVDYFLPSSDRATILNSLGGNEFNQIVNTYSFSDINMDGKVDYFLPSSDRAAILNNLGGNEFDNINKQY